MAMSDMREYKIWYGMKHRCERPTNAAFRYYGARGIKVCQRWKRFLNFLDDMGPAPSRKHGIDRIDNNGDYEPGNCMWATSAEQSVNKSSNRVLELNGVKKVLAHWAKERGLHPYTINRRLANGESDEQALAIGRTRKRQ